MRIADIFKTANDLVLRQYKIRLDSVTENEKEIKAELDAKLESQTQQNSVGDIDDDDDCSEDYDDALKKLSDFKKGNQNDDATESDDDDSEYDVFGGEGCLYDSVLDKIDELNFMKDTVDVLYTKNFQYYQQITKMVEVQEMVNCLSQVSELKKREAHCMAASEALAVQEI